MNTEHYIIMSMLQVASRLFLVQHKPAAAELYNMIQKFAGHWTLVVLI